MANAPIALFVYSRPDHTRATIEALVANELAASSDLIIYADAPRSPDKEVAVKDVREFIETISGFKSVTLHHRTHNYGLANSIIQGVTEVLRSHDRIIVLEDDMVTSPYFLTYMNEALERFALEDQVISIHGYVYPVKSALPEAFFLRGADCWGWATWRRGWALFNPNGQDLLDELKRRQLLNAFDFNDSYGYSEMLRGQIEGLNDSWAVRWYASAFLADKLTLYPGRTLVHNIGNDGSGTHSGDSGRLYDVNLSKTPIDLSKIEVSPSEIGYASFEAFFTRTKGSFRTKLQRQIKKVISKMLAQIS
jgi:hypothetical protein